MTQIRHLTQPIARRAGELGVHSLDRFHFSVPDLEQVSLFAHQRVSPLFLF